MLAQFGDSWKDKIADDCTGDDVAAATEMLDDAITECESGGGDEDEASACAEKCAEDSEFSDEDSTCEAVNDMADCVARGNGCTDSEKMMISIFPFMLNCAPSPACFDTCKEAETTSWDSLTAYVMAGGDGDTEPYCNYLSSLNDCTEAGCTSADDKEEADAYTSYYAFSLACPGAYDCVPDCTNQGDTKAFDCSDWQKASNCAADTCAGPTSALGVQAVVEMYNDAALEDATLQDCDVMGSASSVMTSVAAALVGLAAIVAAM